MIEPSKSPKINNNALPSINQAFSSHFSSSANDNTNNILDSFDATFFDDFTIKSEDANEFNFNNYESFNEHKPNREFKNIWHHQQQQQLNHNLLQQHDINNYDNSSNDDNNLHQIAEADEEEKVINELIKPIRKSHKQYQKKLSIKDDEVIEEQHDQQNEQEELICLWTECHQTFKSQSALVTHIEKTHVCSAKSEEYTCLWADCPRQYRSFNARYKLLIHMRVHSGHKPNKCPVSN
jgi:hypothetical protein